MTFAAKFPAWLILGAILFAHRAPAQNPPLTPIIIEPSTDGQVVSPSDVHMVTAPFLDPDPGDAHFCSDFEIWTTANTELVWIASCVTGIEKIHIHLGDGTFVNSLAGRNELDFDTDHELRIRHQDSMTNWSPYASRYFVTGSPSEVFSLELHDVLDNPLPTWTENNGAEIVLPDGAVPASLRIESAAQELVLGFQGGTGLINPDALGEHVLVRIRVQAGVTGQELILPQSTISFITDEGTAQNIYLPPLALSEGEEAFFWVSLNGSTYFGQAGQTEPDLSNLAQGAPVPWSVLTPGYQVEVFATGFQLPVNIAFVPNPGTNALDPYFYVTELYGNIKAVTRNGTVFNYATNLLNFNPTGDFPGSGEQGLAGIVVEPETGDIFASLLYEDSGGHLPEVLRFHSGPGGLVATGQTVIIMMPLEPQGASHQISNLSLGPDDGLLYVHMGDGFNDFTSTDHNFFRGKILRLNLDGSAVTNNPFYNDANGTNAADYIYAYGFRNPFGGGWRHADGFHYAVENGPDANDRLARIVPGFDYGWTGSSSDMTNHASFNWNPPHAPVNLVFVQTNVFQGSGYPPDKMDHLFVTESGPTYATGPQALGKRIVEFVLDGSGNLVSGPETLVEYNGSGKATAVGLTAGPDGLYFTDLYKDLDYTSPIDRGANVLRIKFVGSADFAADAVSGPTPFSVQFTNLSTVLGASTFKWSFGDGKTSSQPNPLHTYLTEGFYDAELRVAGSNGVSIQHKSSFIRVGSPKPALFIVLDTTLGSGDRAVSNRLAALGFAPIVVKTGSETTSGDATGKTLVVLSSTEMSDNVNSKFRDVPVPVLSWESFLYDNLGMVDVQGVDSGTSIDQAQVHIVSNEHFLAAGLVSTVTVVSTPRIFTWGVPNSNAAIIATLENNPEHAVIFGYESNAVMPGLIAPARRLGFFLEDLAAADLNHNGERLLDAALFWVTGQEQDTDGDGRIDLLDTDDDDDLMLDYYEDLYGLDRLDNTDAAIDSDVDGHSNFEEFRADTDPTNSASVLQLDIHPEAGFQNLGVSWPGREQVTYQLQVTPALTNADWQNQGQPVIPVDHGSITLTNPVQTNAFYYRLLLP